MKGKRSCILTCQQITKKFGILTDLVEGQRTIQHEFQVNWIQSPNI
jgi:hypothetical protein